MALSELEWNTEIRAMLQQLRNSDTENTQTDMVLQ